MKIANVSNGSVTTYYQTISIEDGPMIQAGSQYTDDTEFKVETVKRKRLQDKPWGDVTVLGHRDTGNPNLGVMEHRRVFSAGKIPHWLTEILVQGMLWLPEPTEPEKADAEA